MNPAFAKGLTSAQAAARLARDGPNAVPESYLADVFTRIVSGHPQSDIDQLLPWRYKATTAAVV